MQEIKEIIARSVKEIDSEIAAETSRPDSKFGDYSTNAALLIANKLSKNPVEIARLLKTKIENNDEIEKVEIAGPGFVNITLSNNFLIKKFQQILEKNQEFGRHACMAGKTVLVEYLDPNPFKEIHIGHAYSGTVGDAIASLFEAAGAKVHRLTYQGDVGLNAAKAVYGILKEVNNNIDELEKIPSKERSRFLSNTYVCGAKEYEHSEEAKKTIEEINKKIYDKSDSTINRVWEIGRQWSLQYFDEVYKMFGFIEFDKNYMESMVAEEGVKIVNEHISDGVFEKSDGAIIFRGEKFGLHTRVFINSQGLPTYDAKDLGNASLKMRDWNYNRSIIITGAEQAEYFKVMLKALEQFAPKQAKDTTHISHGLVKLSVGKMSSRTGNVVRAVDLLEKTQETAKKMAKDPNKAPIKDNSLAAIKYAFLKNRIGSDIIYNVEESLSLEGNSGPYIQYAYVRACSILKKGTQSFSGGQLTLSERRLVGKLIEYPEIVQKATDELMPHHICTYLFELAQTFNRFYENDRVIGHEREAFRLSLVSAYSIVLKNGLKILNIPTPEYM